MPVTPVCVLSRDAAIEVLSAVTCAPITRTIRGIGSEVEVGRNDGLSEPSVISCDNLITIPIELFEGAAVGHIGFDTQVSLDGALRYALDIRY